MKRKTLDDCHKIAKKIGILCISTKYVSSKSKMKWKCKNNHIWSSTYNRVSKGHSCPYCVGVAKKTIKECKNLAKKRGGKCLSTQYINNRTKMRWQCKKGHIWETTYDNVSRGRWCRVCGGTNPLTIEDCKVLAKKTWYNVSV